MALARGVPNPGEVFDEAMHRVTLLGAAQKAQLRDEYVAAVTMPTYTSDREMRNKLDQLFR